MIRYKVMLVDDEYMILEGLKYIVDWQSLGFEIVFTTRSAKEAIASFEKYEIDLLISDITMPEMTGLDMIETLKGHGFVFKALILSGYKEFEYVKKSLTLGVENYLVKPVDKKELIQNLKEIYSNLEARQDKTEQERVLKNNLLINWLNDELNEAEFQSLMSLYDNVLTPIYTPVEFNAQTSFLRELEGCLQAKPGVMLIDKFVDEGQLTVIFALEKESLDRLLTEIANQFVRDDYQAYIGETVVDWETLYVGYRKITQTKNIEEFYPELKTKRTLNTVTSLTTNEKINYVGFNKALTIGDFQTISNELEIIFQNLMREKIDPDRAKSIALLLFTDIYRTYPHISEETYHQEVTHIRRSQTLDEMRKVLVNILNASKDKREIHRYSGLVREAITIIYKEFAQELTLKSVADMLHINPVYFGQLFKKETEMSFNQFINQMRIKKAQKMLIETQLTINEISEQIGYNNTNYFSKMFKKLNGLSPKEFRDEYYSHYDAMDNLVEE